MNCLYTVTKFGKHLLQVIAAIAFGTTASILLRTIIVLADAFPLRTP
jgi:hypothetical protein